MSAVGISSPGRRRSLRQAGTVAARILFYALLVMVFAGPLFAILSTAISAGQQSPTALKLFPTDLTFTHLEQAWAAGAGRYLWNSIVVVGFGLVAQVAVSALAAYALARKRFRGAGAVLLIMLSTMMLPEEIIAIPLYLVLSDVPIAPGIGVNLINTYAGMILPVVGWAFSIFILTQFMRAIPDELEGAARIDGAGELTLFFRVILPLCKPALGTTAIFGFLMIWDQYMLPLLVAQDKAMSTITLALTQLKASSAEEAIGPGMIMAASLLAMLPSLLAYLGMQRFYNRGLLSGALKG